MASSSASSSTGSGFLAALTGPKVFGASTGAILTGFTTVGEVDGLAGADWATSAEANI